MNQLEVNYRNLLNTTYLFGYKRFDMEQLDDDHVRGDNETFSNDTRIDIISLFKGFYCLQMLEAMGTPDEFLRSHVRWKNDFEHLKNWYYKTMARMIYDYSVLSCFGELRHGNSQCEKTIDAPWFWEHRGGNREELVRNPDIPYTAQSIIHMSDLLFNHYDWNGGYGGSAWGAIADAQKLYIKGQEAVYIDHCVDLEHNNGSYFNKDLIFWISTEHGSLHSYLDFKYSAEMEELLMRVNIREIQELILRANALGIIPTLSKYFHFESDSHVSLPCSVSNGLHRFFPKPPLTMYNSMGIIETMKLYHPYQFGKEILTSRDICTSDEWGNSEEEEEDYYDNRRRDA